MGCCFSSTSSRSPYSSGQNEAASSSARAITSSQPGLHHRPSTNHTTNSATSRSDNEPARPVPNHPAARLRARQISQLSEHYNAPLRRHVWRNKPNSRVWTRSTLDRERLEFFETRVTGQIEIWQTIRAALELLWAESITGIRQESTEEDVVDDPEDRAYEVTETLATAQSILDAADITMPTGDLADGAYDAKGNLYPLPEYIVSDPLNLAPSPAPSEADNENKSGDEEEAAGDASDDTEEIARRREEKGKNVLRRSPSTTIKVKARFSDRGGKDLEVEFGKADSVRLLRRLLHEEAMLPTGKRIRIAYMGKFLKETEPLPSQGWVEGHVVNAFVFES